WIHGRERIAVKGHRQDKGFDPLIRHLVGRGFTVRRADSMVEALGSRAPPAAVGAARSAPPGHQHEPLAKVSQGLFVACVRQWTQSTSSSRTRRRLKATPASGCADVCPYG